MLQRHPLTYLLASLYGNYLAGQSRNIISDII